MGFTEGESKATDFVAIAPRQQHRRRRARSKGNNCPPREGAERHDQQSSSEPKPIHVAILPHERRPERVSALVGAFNAPHRIARRDGNKHQLYLAGPEAKACGEKANLEGKWRE
jgi:hypothetical protein